MIGVGLAPVSERIATLVLVCTPFVFLRHRTVDAPFIDKPQRPS
jgi:hypothetical protein